ncbi:hypothetical protein HYFRA_00005214 [Hymenoscyphus fraxineus]|uniref:Uncharacterized protein n=1 Tax=Hymenoscyphus fraxineus TaxID=746836 RepID=A0A9N9PW77_9HELO|nr:hypothetical protein HYFRA_00005214 [Hymenoscyphus fraxineus]
MSFETGCLIGYQGFVEDTCGCIEAHDLDECQCRDRNIVPNPLIVSNPRGMTIGDVISAANPCFIEQKRAILIAESFYKNRREWQAEDDEASFYQYVLHSRSTQNGATLDELRKTMAEWAMRVKKKGYTVFAAGEVPERVIGRIDATPMTE